MTAYFALIGHREGTVEDTAPELLAAAAQMAAGQAVTALVAGKGATLDPVCETVAGMYPAVWRLEHEDLAHPNAEVVRKALLAVLPADAVVLMAHDTFGMDLGPGLSIKLDSAYVPDVVSVDASDGTTMTVIRQEFGGQVSTHVQCDIGSGAVVTVRPGAVAADASSGAGGAVEDKSGELGDLTVGRRFVETIPAEVGDVDITKSDVLVSVGRGIEDADNIEIAEELAEALGAVVSCSRPIVDAKWMEKSRQVGTSGQTVKPKVYLACGISGSFQHMGGVKGNPFVVAINKNVSAPIFQVADVGIEADIIDFLPELTEHIKEMG